MAAALRVPREPGTAAHGAAGQAAGLPRAGRAARGRGRRLGCRRLEGRAAGRVRRARGGPGRGTGQRDAGAGRRRRDDRARAAPMGAGRPVRCRDRDPGSARRCRGGIVRRRRACRRRAGERDRQAGILRLPVRRHRQPVAGGGRDLDRRCRTHPGPGHSPPDRDAAAGRPRGLGRGGPAAARSDRGRAACAPPSTRLLGTFRRHRLHRAPGPSAGVRLARAADRRPRRLSASGGSAWSGRVPAMPSC